MTLFERVRGRLQPTVQVQSLFEEIEKTQRMMQRVNDLADALAEHGTGVLRLASIPSLAQYLVPRAVARFQQRHPELLLRLGTTALPSLITDVLQGEAELGLVVMQADHPFLVSGPCMWGAWWRPFRADTSWPGARWSAWLICRRIRTSSSAPACPTGCWC